jgi:hypothetical protein
MDEIIEEIIEAESLNEARQITKSKLPLGYFVLSEEVISDGVAKMKVITADSINESYLKGEELIQNGAKILEKREIKKAERRYVEVKDFNEEDATEKIKQKLSKYEIFESIKIKDKGRKGFFGVGRKPKTFLANIQQMAAVEIKYKESAKIKIRMKKLSSKYKFSSIKSVQDALYDLKNIIDQPRSKIDKYRNNPEMERLFAVQAIFTVLIPDISERFNSIINSTKQLYPEDKYIQSISYLSFTTPDAFDAYDFPLAESMLDQAWNAVKNLIEKIDKK